MEIVSENMLQSFEWEIILLHFFNSMNLRNEHVFGNIGIAVNSLIVNFLKESGSLRFIVYFISEGEIRRIYDITPKASNFNAVTSFFLKLKINWLDKHLKNLLSCLKHNCSLFCWRSFRYPVLFHGKFR